MRKVVLFLLSLPLSMAQHHTPPPPEKPVALISGLGVWKHPIATKNPDAQKFFDQGLALLYGFNRYESLRSFRKASELDPEAAMPYWGMAMSQAAYINMDGDPSYDQKASCAALEPARKLTNVPPRERDYLQAAAARCPEHNAKAYIDAMRALAARYPDDLDAATFYAEALMIPPRWQWYSAEGKPAEGMAEAEHTLEAVLRRWPEHPGANHYYIHAVESSPTPERGIPSAQRLMGIVPEAGHMVHMPGHIWLATGDYATAAGVNERAAEVDRQYFAATNVNSSYAMYYAHNLHFITYAKSMQGRGYEAIHAADDLANTLVPYVQEMPDMVDSFLAVTLLTRVRFGDWQGVLEVRPPNEKLPLMTAMFRYSRASALAGAGDRAGALREQAAFEVTRAKIPADAMWGVNKAVPVLALAAEVIAARVAPSPAEALPHWEKAVSMQDALVYDEPPAWYFPIRESLGGTLLRAGKPAAAEAVFREGLRRSPRNGRILFGLMQSLRAQSKTDAAASVQREFEAAWSKATVTLRVEDLN